MMVNNKDTQGDIVYQCTERSIAKNVSKSLILLKIK